MSPSNADNKMKWESSDKNVVVVDQNGKVTAIANGFAIIAVKSEDGSI